MPRVYPLLDDTFISKEAGKQYPAVISTFLDITVASPGGGGGTTHLLETLFGSRTEHLQYLSLELLEYLLDNSITAEEIYTSLNNGCFLQDGSVTVQESYSSINERAFLDDGSITRQESYNQLNSNIILEDSSLTGKEVYGVVNNNCYIIDETLTAGDASLSIETVLSILLEVIDSSKTAQFADFSILMPGATEFNSRTAQESYSSINFRLENQDNTQSSGGIFAYLNANAESISNSRTFSLSQPVINALLYSIVSSYTQDFYDLNIGTIGVHQLEMICSALTRMEPTVNLSFNCEFNSQSYTSEQSNLSLLQSIQTIIESRTSQFGAVLNNVGLDVKSSTRTSDVFSFNLNIPLGMVDSTLTALIGALSSEGAPIIDNGNEISIMVYINTGDQHTLYVKRDNLGNLHINRNKNFNLYE